MYPTLGQSTILVLDFCSRVQIYELLVISVISAVRLGYCKKQIYLLLCLLVLSLFTSVTYQLVLGIMLHPGSLTLLL